MNILVLSPVAEEHLEPKAKFADMRSSGLDGKVVGILENGWPSMAAIAADLKDILTKKYGVAEVRLWTTGISQPADPAIIDEIAKLVDIGVIGLGN